MTPDTDPTTDAGSAQRVCRLLGMTVHGPSGRGLGRVVDLRVSPSHDEHGRLRYVVDGFLVGAGRTGGLLGYDRRQEQGPALFAALMRRVHHDTRLFPWTDIATIDWRTGQVHVTTDHGHSPIGDRNT